MRLRLLALLPAALALIAGSCSPAPVSVEEISADELQTLVDAGEAPLILDVRTPAEYAQGHVPGAVNIPHDQVPGRIDGVEGYGADQVVVYCRSGKRAGLAADALVEAGIPVLHLVGDMAGWERDGRPIEAPGAQQE